MVEPPRPPIELGRQQYTSGQYDESSTLFGRLNPLLPGLAIYGDWRTAVAYNSNNGKDIAQIATRLNVDVDLKLTGTERIHAFFTPLQKNNEFTRYEFGGGDGNSRFNDEFDLNPQTLFFEGDFGSIYSGFSGTEARFDLPFTVGLFPLFLQNGTWANDAILGGAVTLPARNSRKLGLPNYDITFFAAFDNVDNAGILGARQEADANIYGVTTFIDAFGGYIEAGYGLLQGRDELDGQHALPDRRLQPALFQHRVELDPRVRELRQRQGRRRLCHHFGEQPDHELAEHADPLRQLLRRLRQPSAPGRWLGAGILKNVGINFETDALTGYPKLNDTGADTFGGAIGLTYLFGKSGPADHLRGGHGAALRRHVVIPVHTQYGFGARYQIALNRAWLLRADATYQLIEDGEDNFGVRMELRRKF